MTKNLDFLSGGGRMGGLIRAYDWAAHPLGPPENWPSPLKTTIRIMLTTQHPIYIFWGPELFCFYNDAYSRSIGPEKDPWMLGEKGRDVWPEIWEIIGPQIDYVMAGEGATWHENALVPIMRHGRVQDVYWTYSYGPIDDPAAPNGVGGILVVCSETTEKVESEQRIRDEAEDAQALLRETHHRVKNNIASIIAVVNLELRRADREELRQPLQRIASRLQSFSKLYEMMLTASSVEEIDAGAYIERLATTIGDISKGASAGDIEIHARGARCHLPVDEMIAVGSIAVELINNALTHAFPDGSGGAIHVEMEHRSGQCSLTVRDNGVGADRAHVSSHSTGIGMQLVDHYADSLNATLDKRSDSNGTSVTVTFPLAASEQTRG